MDTPTTVDKSLGMSQSLRFLPAALTNLVRMPHRVARGLLVRDLDAWLRVEFLGVAADIGLASALSPGLARTVGELRAACDLEDADLLEALLALGVALGELRERDGGYVAHGRRLRGVADARAAGDLAGLVQEAALFSGAIYRNLGRHLGGAGPGDYFAGADEIVAQSSRLAEAALAPVISSVVRETQPSALLDVGCGSGIYLEHSGRAAPRARLFGIDVAADAVAAARARVGAAGLADRCEVHHADLFGLPAALAGPYEVVLLLQNIYYWRPEQRPGVFERLRRLVPNGVAVVASAVPSRLAMSRHLDLVMRVSVGTSRLPTREELASGLAQAGFAAVEVVEPLPATGFAIAIAR